MPIRCGASGGPDGKRTGRHGGVQRRRRLRYANASPSRLSMAVFWLRLVAPASFASRQIAKKRYPRLKLPMPFSTNSIAAPANRIEV
jgi:hypothetical protein